MIGWYRQRALAWLPRRIAPRAVRMAQYPGSLDVRDLGYRWGSLGKNDRLNIHWAAMQLPVSLLDYVIVHELAHIGEPRHTPGFWAAVERALPDYGQLRVRHSGPVDQNASTCGLRAGHDAGGSASESSQATSTGP